MSDKYWSLRGKQFMVDDGYALLSTHLVDSDGLFDASDIDVLRQKLIDDWTELYISTSEGEDIEGRMITIINKCFGVDKSDE